MSEYTPSSTANDDGPLLVERNGDAYYVGDLDRGVALARRDSIVTCGYTDGLWWVHLLDAPGLMSEWGSDTDPERAMRYALGAAMGPLDDQYDEAALAKNLEMYGGKTEQVDKQPMTTPEATRARDLPDGCYWDGTYEWDKEGDEWTPLRAPFGMPTQPQVRNLRRVVTQHPPIIAKREASAWAAEQHPEVVCICGSTRFRVEMTEANRQLTMQGMIVLAPGVYGHDGDPLTEEDKQRLDTLHFRKIDMSDRVVVIAPSGYVGSSTTREIAYAKEQGKPVEVWDDWPDPDTYAEGQQ